MHEEIFPAPMLLFGCGNMAGAMLRGWLASGHSASSFHIFKPTPDNLPEGVRYFNDIDEATGRYETLLLGVKPQMLADVAPNARKLLANNGTLISILAGAESQDLQKLFPDARIVRVMPNLAVELGLSPLGIWAEEIAADERERIDAMLQPIGFPVWLQSEAQMDAFTALAGSGPAFVYRFIDAVAAAGVAIGLPQEQSQRLALQMIEGAVALAVQSDSSPDELARQVASRGGMAAQGLGVLDSDKALEKLLEETLRAARDRGADLSKKARGEK